jgi:hypothetical protein
MRFWKRFSGLFLDFFEQIREFNTLGLNRTIRLGHEWIGFARLFPRPIAAQTAAGD